MKRAAFFLLVAAMLLAMLCGCQNTSSEQTEYVGIISAMDNEIETLVSETKIDHVDTIGGIDYYVGTLRGCPVVIARSGVGKIRAASGATTMLERYPISHVVFTGIAGGVSEKTKLLDEVIATQLVEHDYGKIANDGFKGVSGDPGTSTEPEEYYQCDPMMVDLAYEAAVEVLGEERVFKGTIATGDQYIASEKEVERLRRDYDAYACEMEGAAVAVVCQRYGKPFVVLRALSDMADGNAHESYANFGDNAAAQSSLILIKVLDNIGK